MGGFWPGFAATCAPSSSTVRGSLVRRPTSCFRAAAFMDGRSSDRLPTKSTLFLPMAQVSPASSGVTVPSVSWPTMM